MILTFANNSLNLKRLKTAVVIEMDMSTVGTIVLQSDNPALTMQELPKWVLDNFDFTVDNETSKEHSYLHITRKPTTHKPNNP